MVCPLRVITGGSMSLTVTVKLQVLELPAASVAIACTVVVPTGKLEPDRWSVVTVGTEQLSVAVTVKLAGAAHVPEIAFTLIFAGHEIDGAMLSMTVIVCDALEVLLDASVALYVRVMISGLAGEPAG